MLKHKYSLNSQEDSLMSFLKEKHIDFAPLFYNSAIPIKELFYFFVFAGNSLYEFDRMPKLLTELTNFNVVHYIKNNTDDLRKVSDAIRNCANPNGVLVKILNSAANEQWAYIKAIGKDFRIESEWQKFNDNISDLELKNIYGGEFIQLKLLCDYIPNFKQLFMRRLFKPEQYIPFYFVESDLENIEGLHLKMINMFYAYKVTRYRMIKYYSFFTNVDFMQSGIKKVEIMYNLLISQKNTANIKRKCFSLLHELNKEDVLMMSQLKEKLEELR